MSLDLSLLGFRKTPFTRELSIAERCALPHQAEAAEALAEVVRRRMSAALIAPAGTGKTVTLRMLVSCLPQTRYHVRYVKVTGLSKRKRQKNCRSDSVPMTSRGSGRRPDCLTVQTDPDDRRSAGAGRGSRHLSAPAAAS